MGALPTLRPSVPPVMVVVIGIVVVMGMLPVVPAECVTPPTVPVPPTTPVVWVGVVVVVGATYPKPGTVVPVPPFIMFTTVPATPPSMLPAGVIAQPAASIAVLTRASVRSQASFMFRTPSAVPGRPPTPVIWPDT
jgi:hypothetical protein